MIDWKSAPRVVVAGIGTEVGKTVISAILVEALKADYWKPVQAGELSCSDTDKVRQWIGGPENRYHPEGYRLQLPMSPHAAAAREGIEIDPSRLVLPETQNPLVIELAGGLMVPLTPDFLNIDLLQRLRLPVVLVSNYYLGNINHTLLSVEVLKRRTVKCLGIIFNGERNEETRSVILSYTGLKPLLDVNPMEPVNRKEIEAYARAFNRNLKA